MAAAVVGVVLPLMVVVAVDVPLLMVVAVVDVPLLMVVVVAGSLLERRDP
jgi:hypothetical protein